MIFINNKYTRWYNSIISNAQKENRKKLKKTHCEYVYYESHHIIPKSLCGNNSKENLVILTAREHYVCHKLLTKMTLSKDKVKMTHALWRMVCTQNRHQERFHPTSRSYQFARKLFVSTVTGRHMSSETKQKLRDANLGKVASDSTRAKMSRRAPAQNSITNEYLGKISKDDPRWESGEIISSIIDRKCSDEGKAKLKLRPKRYNFTHSEDTRVKLRIPKEKFLCPVCHALIGGKSNYNRYHGSNCGRPISEELRKKISDGVKLRNSLR